MANHKSNARRNNRGGKRHHRRQHRQQQQKHQQPGVEGKQAGHNMPMPCEEGAVKAQAAAPQPLAVRVHEHGRVIHCTFTTHRSMVCDGQSATYDHSQAGQIAHNFVGQFLKARARDEGSIFWAYTLAVPAIGGRGLWG